RVVPAVEARPVVGADDEEDVAVALRRPTDGVDGVRGPGPVELVARQLDLRQLREGRLREAVADLGRRPDLLARRVAGRDHDEAVEVEALDGRPRNRDVTVVRWIEGTAEEAGQTHSWASPAISTSVPFFTPAATSARSSS